jgi:hypothetical protein
MGLHKMRKFCSLTERLSLCGKILSFMALVSLEQNIRFKAYHIADLPSEVSYKMSNDIILQQKRLEEKHRDA